MSELADLARGKGMKEEIDCNGVYPLGLDDDGSWMGTPNAWWVLGDTDTSGCDENGVPDGSCDGPDWDPATPTFFEVSGFWFGEAFVGYFVASSFEEVRHHMAYHSIVDVVISPGTRLSKKHVYKVGRIIYLTDEQAEARLAKGRIVNEDGQEGRSIGS